MQSIVEAGPSPARIVPEARLLRPRVGVAIFFGTVAAFAVLTMWLAARLNLYIDEAYSLHTTDHGVAYAFEQSLGFEQQPPLYFVALAIWRQLDREIFFARLTSIACVVGALFIVRDFSRRWLRNVPDWLPTLLVAANPFAIWAAVELRVYALIVLLSATLISLFFRAFFEERPARRDVVAFACVAVAALYTQYFFVFTLSGLGLAVLVFQRRRFGTYLKVMAVAIAALTPMLGIVRRQMHDASVEIVLNPRAHEAEMVSTIASFVLPHTWINAIDLHAINIVYMLVFMTMTVLAAIGIRRNRIVIELALLTGTIFAGFSFLILIERDPIDMPRHITTLFLPILLTTIAAVSSSFGGPRRRNVLALYLAIYAICAGAETIHVYRPMAKLGDWMRVSQFLEVHARPTEPIVVFDAEVALPLHYYYGGENQIVPIPHEQDFSVFDRRAFAFSGAADVARSFPRASPKTHELWLVSGRPCRYVPLGDSCMLLARYVDDHFTTVGVTQFDGTGVYELRTRTTRASVPSAAHDRSSTSSLETGDAAPLPRR